MRRSYKNLTEGVSELSPAPQLSFEIFLRLDSLLSRQLKGGQRSYTQYLGIKNKLIAEALQMAQLTPPSWRVGVDAHSSMFFRICFYYYTKLQ